MSVLANGTVIDNRYKVRGRIGSGGMADVYLCDDQHLGRPVALKVMHERFASDRSFIERFEREAQAAARLQHKNVVNVFDRGQVGNTYYIAMEYLPGRTLKDVINAMGALDPKLAIHICTQILAAERFAHSKGLVHRDIKPQNVMIDDEWNVKVTDFGIAHDPVDGDITQTGQMVGTAQYISPEQAQGKPVSNASDLYSTGVVLFEMLTGKVPFEGDASVAIALQHINQPVPRPSSVNPTVPPALDEIVVKAMAKSPVERFASADEFSHALERARDNLGAPAGKTEVRTAVAGAAPAAAKSNKKRNWIIAGCIVAAVVIAGLAYFLLVGNKAQVPNVVGHAAGEARSMVAEAGFKSQVFTQTNKAPAGEVISQSPQGGQKAKKGSTVILNVSSGPGEVTMPDVEGMSQADATNQLEALGLTVRVVKEFDQDIAKGKATRTVPAASQKAQKGSEVDLYISKGAEQVALPNVVGQDVDEATKTLEDAGFEVTTTTQDSSKPKDEVIKQSPSSSKADKGAKVKLTVASGQNDVPSVTGLKTTDARSQLQDAGFTVAIEYTDVSKQDENGIVQTQDPATGTAEVGSSVTIEVGKFKDDGTVP